MNYKKMDKQEEKDSTVDDEIDDISKTSSLESFITSTPRQKNLHARNAWTLKTIEDEC